MCSSCEFDDEEVFKGIYENGHWEWDEKSEGLEFIPDPNLYAEDSWMSPPVAAIGAADFKDDIDVIEQTGQEGNLWKTQFPTAVTEVTIIVGLLLQLLTTNPEVKLNLCLSLQQRLKKIFLRKTFEDDVVKLQDIKDIVLYTAPPTFITPSVVHLMHLPGTDRFLRGLILYHQYYLQIADEMGRRMLDLESKVRTPESDIIEEIYKENLEDLRLLIAKEYSTFVTELETHRLFKTQKYNMIEHKLKSNYVAKMSPQERYVLFGSCIRNERVKNMCSPLMNEINCKSISDWRLLGLGILKYPNLCSRLQYLQDALILPERLLVKKRVTVGILGLLRSRFDIMLKEIPFAIGGSSSTSMAGTIKGRRSTGRTSRASRSPRVSSSSRKSTTSAFLIPEQLVPDIVFPPREPKGEWLPNESPDENLIQNPCDLNQRRKWMARATWLARKRARRIRQRVK